MFAVGEDLWLYSLRNLQVGGAASCRRTTGDLIPIATVQWLQTKLLMNVQIAPPIALFGHSSNRLKQFLLFRKLSNLL